MYPPFAEEPPLSTLLSWDGGLTLLAPLVAILAALITKRVVGSLAAGVVVGAIVAADGQVLPGLVGLFHQGVSVLFDLDNLKVSSFSLLVAATVGVMGASGGTAAMVARIEALASGRRGAMIATWLSGGAVFFDDYANCLVVGNAMGPVCDRNGVSRAKLAYIVDATAAPIASLALLSTWVAYEVSLLSDALDTASIDGLSLFLSALPYRVYCLLTLVFVGAIVVSGRDFGPMARAEASQRAPATAQATAVDEVAPTHAALAVVPVACLVGVTFAALWIDGAAHAAPGAALFEVIGAARAFDCMLLGSTVAWIVAVVGGVVVGPLAWAEIPSRSWSTARTVVGALAVLYLAWTLGGIVKETGAAAFVASVLEGRLPAEALPVVVFALAAITSFSTGSSFFTMGALIPLVVPLAIGLGGPPGPILFASTAAVLDGSVFGDHTSPISDTTILSSVGSGCDVVTHVRTQLPYALVVGGIAAGGVLIPLGLGIGLPVLLIGGAGLCMAVVWILGRDPIRPSG